MSSFFVIESQNLGLDYFSEAYSAAEMFSMLDRHMSFIPTTM
jgi:hypothetical protein